METTTLRYVEYLYPGTIVAETNAKELTAGVDEMHMVMPPRAVAWRTFERTATHVDGERLLGEIRNRSGWTYYGRRLSIQQVEYEMPNERILIDNMRGNSFDAVVEVAGRMYPLNANDRAFQPHLQPR